MFINISKSKKYSLFVIILFVLLNKNYAISDDQTQSNAVSNALYASFSLHPLEINKQSSLIAGARLVFAFDENLSIGLGSFNMITRNIKSNFYDSTASTNPVLEYNYFSGDAEYNFTPNSFWEFSLKSSLSVAHVRYNLISTEKTVENYSPDYGEDWFYFVEPSINLTRSLSYWLKVKFGLGYRFAFDGNYQFNNITYGNRQLSGFSSGIYLILGNF